ncbi:hypothetical protein RhiirC2_744734 [Rhizophagus irregularis]|uniref:Uncharacterized protein n=1 Tax=Rhizophagus irregularis TaxID=588596 RepID=A0A2N1NBW9_9GLOM|nr:hypothetical protein RhiirC2_744734 [Rhizophagus irregularis]
MRLLYLLSLGHTVLRSDVWRQSAELSLIIRIKALVPACVFFQDAFTIPTVVRPYRPAFRCLEAVCRAVLNHTY